MEYTGTASAPSRSALQASLRLTRWSFFACLKAAVSCSALNGELPLSSLSAYARAPQRQKSCGQWIAFDMSLCVPPFMMM
jgi:hypothetical protein